MRKMMWPIHELEVNAHWQFRFHGIFTVAWFFSMFVAPFIPTFAGNVAGLVLVEVSLWANFATHFGAMSSALSAIVSERYEPKNQSKVG